MTQWTAAARPAACAARIASTVASKSGSDDLGEHELHGAPRDTRMRRIGERERAHHEQPLREGARRRGGLEQRELGGGVARGGVGGARDAEARERRARRREIGRIGRAEPRAQPGVGAVDAARGAPGRVALDAGRIAAAVEAEPLDARRAQDPERAAAVLDAERDARRERVEVAAVERARDRVVVADAADPAPARPRAAQRALEIVARAHLGRAAAHRVGRRGERQQVQVVVVEPGKQRAARRVEALLAAAGLERRADLRDPLARDPHERGARPAISARSISIRAPPAPRPCRRRAGARGPRAGARAARARARARPPPRPRSRRRTRTTRASRAEPSPAAAAAATSRERHVEEHRLARAERLERRHRGVCTRERIGDRVAAEERSGPGSPVARARPAATAASSPKAIQAAPGSRRP